MKHIMVFIDGTNFLSEIGRVLGLKYDGQKPPYKALDAATSIIANMSVALSNTYLDSMYIRRFWFGSYKGDEKYYYKLREYLRARNFEPVLYKVHDDKEKGVDIALTRQMLLNAFQGNYEIGLVIAGDEDYVELINDVKRFGIIVIGSFFEDKGLSKELKITYDRFLSMSDTARINEISLTTYKTEILEEIKSSKEQQKKK